MIRLPDTEAAVVALLREALPTAHASDRLAPPYPAIRALQIGGTAGRIGLGALIQIDVAGASGSSKAACRDLIETAIGALRDAEGRTVAGVVMAAVQVSSAAGYLPDAVTGAPRYTATLAVFARRNVPTA